MTFIFGFIAGFSTMYTLHCIKAAPLKTDWHFIGKQIQYMERINLKLNDGGTLTSELSEN